MTTSDEHLGNSLIVRFRAGDEDAFRVLFDRCQAAVQGKVARRLPPALLRRVSIADVVQDTAMIAFSRRGDFVGDDADAFRRWVIGIADRKAKRTIQHHTQKGKRAAAREVSRDRRCATGEYAGAGPSPSQLAMAAETRALADEALARLSEEQRLVLQLVRDERLPFRDVAERLGRSLQSTYKLHARALFQFTEIFQRLRGGGDDE